MSNNTRPRQPRSGGTRKLAPSRSGKYSCTVLYEDDDILAVDKPCGIPTISPEGSRTKSLYDMATNHIRRRNPKGRAAVVHRLDKETSGVILFAKNARTKTELMSAWNETVDERVYVALVEGGPPSDSGVFDTYLAEKDPYRVHQVAAGIKGSFRAITRYSVLATGGGYSLLELRLETGRRHQIRVQLAAAGCPVTGDERYGARLDPLGRLGLHASLISFTRGQGQNPIRVESPPPPGFMATLRNPAVRGSTAVRGGTALHGSTAPQGRGGEKKEPRSSREPREHRASDYPPQSAGPLDRTRAWPGGGPASRAGNPGPSSKKSSSSYSTRSKRKP